MNNLYHKVAIASVCTALSFTLGANKEAKAATITFTTPGFLVQHNDDGTVVFGNYSGPSISKEPYASRAFYEFNIGNFSLPPNTVIKSAFLNVTVSDIRASYKYFFIDLLGYVGNGIRDLSDFGVGERLSLIDLRNVELIPDYPYPYSSVNIDVTQFVNRRVSNGDAFAGFGLRKSTLTYSDGTARVNNAKLTIETVPEPTTIFGSALALGVGGWLKRKKSTPQNKAKSQA